MCLLDVAVLPHRESAFSVFGRQRLNIQDHAKTELKPLFLCSSFRPIRPMTCILITQFSAAYTRRLGFSTKPIYASTHSSACRMKDSPLYMNLTFPVARTSRSEEINVATMFALILQSPKKVLQCTNLISHRKGGRNTSLVPRYALKEY
jgi:hypothetical protein